MRLSLTLMLLVVVAQSMVAADERKPKKLTLKELVKQRKKMAQRRRRIIFNNDGDDIGRLGPRATKEGLAASKHTNKVFPISAAGFLDVRTTKLVGSHVDAIWYYSSWGMKLHHTNGPFARMYGAPDTWQGGRSTKNYKAVRKQAGKDTLELTIDFCRKHQLEVFYSNRMNDIHDSFQTANLYNLRRKYPQWCLSTKAKGRKYSYPDVRSCWSAWNFAIPEVRRYTVEALREVCRTYDIDGIELDFFRHFVYFPETMQFKPATPAHIEMMTDMMRKIRRVAEEEGLRRGRPILLAARCLEDMELSRNTGLDVATWLKEDLVDLLSVAISTEYHPPFNDLTTFAKRFKTPVYPILAPLPTASPNNLNSIPARMKNLPVWRGQALSYFSQGVSGIQFFNMFDPTVPQWSELGEPKSLVMKNRTYVWDYRPSKRKTRPTFAQMRVSRYIKPVKVGRKSSPPMPLYVGEDLSKTARQFKLRLRVRVHGLKRGHGFELSLNDRRLSRPIARPALSDKSQTVWLYYGVAAGDFKEGLNPFVAKLASAGKEIVTVDQIRLDVRAME